jgi:hypothetical protein
MYATYVRRKSMYLLEVFKSANHNKDSARKSPKCHICGRSANLTNYLSPQIFVFAIFEIYLRTPHLRFFLLFSKGLSTHGIEHNKNREKTFRFFKEELHICPIVLCMAPTIPINC